MAGNPSNGRGRGEHVLQCLQVLGPNLAPPPHSDENEEEGPLVQLWDATVPKMLSHLNVVFRSRHCLFSEEELVFGGELHDVDPLGGHCGLRGVLCYVHARENWSGWFCISCRAQGKGHMEPEAVGGPCTEGTVSSDTWSVVTLSLLSLLTHCCQQ